MPRSSRIGLSPPERLLGRTPAKRRPPRPLPVRRSSRQTPRRPETLIEIEILRSGKPEFSGTVPLTELKRELPTLASYLYRDNTFPHGSFLMTGTGIVPPDSFTLESGDEIHITIAPIGTLTNTVAGRL